MRLRDTMAGLPDIPSEFLDASRETGSDPMLVQGPGGNTSCKERGMMWIKASGTELSRAGSEDIFTAVDVTRVLAELDGTGDGSCRAALMNPSQDLRPSIETTFHALLPQRYVFHYHSVRSLAHSIALEGREALHDKLSGLNWSAVPYARPGLPLSMQIRRQWAKTNADIFVLENHGLIVAGDDCGVINETISDVERRLDMPVRSCTAPPPAGKSVSGWNLCLPAWPLASDSVTLKRAEAGSYYPDHVVFLGPALAAAALDELTASSGTPGPAAVVPDVGAFLKEGAGPAKETMLICLSQVLSLIPDGWNLEAIGPGAEAELLGWDAEKHRQRLAGEA